LAVLVVALGLVQAQEEASVELAADRSDEQQGMVRHHGRCSMWRSHQETPADYQT
jgi:hypothetical protein